MLQVSTQHLEGTQCLLCESKVGVSGRVSLWSVLLVFRSRLSSVHGGRDGLVKGLSSKFAAPTAQTSSAALLQTRAACVPRTAQSCELPRLECTVTPACIAMPQPAVLRLLQRAWLLRTSLAPEDADNRGACICTLCSTWMRPGQLVLRLQP